MILAATFTGTEGVPEFAMQKEMAKSSKKTLLSCLGCILKVNLLILEKEKKGKSFGLFFDDAGTALRSNVCVDDTVKVLEFRHKKRKRKVRYGIVQRRFMDHL